MMKKSFSTVLTAWILAIAMILPCVPALAPLSLITNAESAAVVQPDGTITLPNVNNGKPVLDTGFRVGWGQGDFTPSYETQTLPCAFGSSQTKMVANVWDHMYATCVALSDGENITLLFSVDLKNISDDNEGYSGAENNVKVLTNSKQAAKAAAQELGYTIPVENITFTATHNHNAPMHNSTGSGGKNPEVAATMNRWRSQVYYPAIREAATEALSDLAAAEAYAGHADTTNINTTRRFFLEDGSYDGVHTNIDNNDPKQNSYLAHETLADPDLQTIHFRRANKKDIVMVNWQAHCASANNESSNAFTSDCVHYIRKEVEEKLGVHFIYFNGASGNVVIGDSLNGVQSKYKWRQMGEILLPKIVDALEEEKWLDTGEIRVSNQTMTATYRDEGDLPGWNPDEGRCYTQEEIAADKARVLANGKFSKSNYPTTTRWGQAAMIRYEYGQDEAQKNSNALLKKYHFQSWYEPFAMVSRASSNSWYNEGYKVRTTNLPYTAISCGDMAFAFSAYEMFDTNGAEVKSGSPFEMTFMCAYSNGSNGYIPSAVAWEREGYYQKLNRLAQEANQQPIYAFVTDGAGYEVNMTRYVPGTGEAGARVLVELLYEVADEKLTWTVGTGEDYADLNAALAAVATMNWGKTQTLELRVKEDSLISLGNGNLMFGVYTIWRENDTKLPIIITSDSNRVTLTVDLADPTSYTNLFFSNDYTFRDITLDMANKKFKLYAGTGNILFDNVSFGTGSSLRLYADNKTTNALSGWTKAGFDKESEKGLLVSSLTFRNTDYTGPSSEAWQMAYIAASGGNSAYAYTNGDLTVTPANTHAKIIVEEGADLTRVNGYLTTASPVEVGKATILVRGGSVRGICADSGNSVAYHFKAEDPETENSYQTTERNPKVDITVQGGTVYGTGDGVAIAGVTNARYGDDAKIHITISGGVIMDHVIGVGGHAFATGSSSAWYTGTLESIKGEIIIDYYGGILNVPETTDWDAKKSTIYGVYSANLYNCHTLYGDVQIRLHSTLRAPVAGVYSEMKDSHTYKGEIPEGALGRGAVIATGASVTVSHGVGSCTDILTGISGGVVEGTVKLSVNGGNLGELDTQSSTPVGKRTSNAYAMTGSTTIKSGGKVILEADGDGYLYGNFRAAYGTDYTVKSGGSVEVYFNGGTHFSSSKNTSTDAASAKNNRGVLIEGEGTGVSLGFETGSKIRVEMNGTHFQSIYTESFRLFHNATIYADIDLVLRKWTGGISRILNPFYSVNVYGDTTVTVDTTADGWGGSSENAPDATVTIGSLVNDSSAFYGKGTLRVDGGENKTVTIGKLCGFGSGNLSNTVKNAHLGSFVGVDSGSALTGISNDFTNVDITKMVYSSSTADLTDGGYVGGSISASTVNGTISNSFENVTTEGSVICGSSSPNLSSCRCQNIVNYFGKTASSVNVFSATVVAGMTGASLLSSATVTGSITNYFNGSNDVAGTFYGTNQKGNVNGNVTHYLGGTPVFRQDGFLDNISACQVGGSLTNYVTGTITPDTVIKLGNSTSAVVILDGATIEEGAVVSTNSTANVSLSNVLASNYSFQNGTVKGTLSGPEGYTIYSGSFFVAPQGSYKLGGGTIDWNADETHTLTPTSVSAQTTVTRTASPYIEGAVMVQVPYSDGGKLTLDNSRQRGSAEKVENAPLSVWQVVAIGPDLAAEAELRLNEKIGITVLFPKDMVDTAAAKLGTSVTYTFYSENNAITGITGTLDAQCLNGDFYEAFLPSLGASDFRTALHLDTNTNTNFTFTVEQIAQRGAEIYKGQEQKLFCALIDYGAAACGDTQLQYYNASEIKLNDIPDGLGAVLGDGDVVFSQKTLLMGEAIGVRLTTSSGDLSGVKVILGTDLDITSKCVINAENGTLDFYINANKYNDKFTVSVYDANDKLCITITDTVKHIALQMLESSPDNVKTRATAFYIQTVLDYKAYKNPIVTPGNGQEVGTLAPLF